MRRLTAAAAAVLIVAAIDGTPAWVHASTAAARSCAGYRYAGYASRAGVAGIAATVTAARRPVVVTGHAAAWVGIGDKSTWLQAGVAGFPRVGLRLYVESVSRGGRRTFVDLGAARVGHGYRVAVKEVRPDLWQATIDGRRVGSPTYLPAMRGAWRGIATAETWSATPACNGYAFRFGGVSVRGPHRWLTLAHAARVGARVDGRGAGFSVSA